MAGSSLPVTWRLPPLEIPLGRKFHEVLVASRGDLEIFGFHALETLQCMAERRDRGGKPQGVAAVTCLEGDAVWEAGDKGLWSWELLHHALGRSHTVNPGDIRQNTRDFHAPGVPKGDVPTKSAEPVAFLVEYVDGLRATAMILNGHVDDTTVAARIDDSDGGQSIVSTLMYLPAPPGASFFNPLVLRIEDFFRTGKPPYPVAADPADRRDPRRRRWRAASAAIAGSRRPSWRRSTTGPGRLGVHPELVDRSRAEPIVRGAHHEAEACSDREFQGTKVP